jgi:hypothetical protein
MFRNAALTLLALPLFALACSEANDVVPKDSGAKDTSLADSAGGDATADSAISDASVSDGAGVSSLVFNELSATGGDWLEIYNTSSNPVDLSGFKIADNEPDASAPRLSQALVLAGGTVVAPGAYLVIVANEKTASPTPQPCFDGGVSGGCPVATFGISKDTANTFYLLTPTDGTAMKVDMAANAHASGQSWGRFPNGTGNFAVTKPTPGKANEL